MCMLSKHAVNKARLAARHSAELTRKEQVESRWNAGRATHTVVHKHDPGLTQVSSSVCPTAVWLTAASLRLIVS
ncbi:hypothetical protein E2C01_043298 [Portunus trituberculatus]|uniref:Uncharacterized protein n=1 Tax=Portunus trituberculatus TaxID=210409 RepID=A0A5B7FVC7_PORTR|nr:hypothetical protein [Portunus trituberculatus]